jgi:hypothetical protein
MKEKDKDRITTTRNTSAPGKCVLKRLGRAKEEKPGMTELRGGLAPYE